MPRTTDENRPFPLTDVQEAYWIGRQLRSNGGDVSAHLYMEFENDCVDLARLEGALQKLVRRHPMLRAIVRSDGTQVVLDSVPDYEICITDLSNCSAEQRNSALNAIRDRMHAEVRSAEVWPLWELRATRLDGGRTRLHWSVDLLMLDGGSLAIVLREWSALYADPSWSPPAIDTTFEAYVGQLHRQQRAARNEADNTGLQRLSSFPPAPELPSKQALDELEQVVFSRRAGWLDAPKWKRLKEHAQSLGLTPSSVLCALYAEVLRDWSRVPEFTLNVTSAFRVPFHPHIGRVVGDFTTTQLLPVDGAGDTFLERATRINELLLENAARYRSAPGGVRLLKELARRDGRLGGSLMPVVFTSNLGRDSLNGKDFEFLGETVFAVSQTPNVYLDHVVMEDGGALRYHWDAVDDVFPSRVLDDMFSAYQAALETLAGEPDKLRSARVLGSPDRMVRSCPPIADASMLHHGFVTWARRRPADEAVWTPDRTFSYGELLRLANHYCARLRSAEVGPEQLVGVVMHKGWEQVVAVFAVLMAGGAYVPIDPDLPPLRVAELLTEARVRHVLTQPTLEAQLSRHGVQTIPVVSDLQSNELDIPLASDDILAPNRLAYVIYTSGSTGRPKGVMIEHGPACNTIASIRTRFGLGPGDTVFGISSLSFDLSVFDVLGTLSCGARLALPGTDQAKAPNHWVWCTRAARVTVWNSVPALMELALEEVGAGIATALESLRLVLLSGDWIPVSLATKLRHLLPRARLVSLGGATEASVWSIAYPIDQVVPTWTSVPYGRALENQSVYVLDAKLEPRRDHVPGELYIAGYGLARGYLADPEKTAKSFLLHPRTGERLYRTGDWGRYLEDGTIVFLGRADSQVKVHGHRVECGEIEATLTSHERVRLAAVVAHRSSSNETRLIAFVALEPSQPAVSASELRSYLCERLPDYMIPMAIVQRRELPLSAVGKVDRAALARLVPEALDELEKCSSSAEEATELSDAERSVAAIVSRVLERPSVGVHDNLFEIGADSLHAIRILRALEKSFGIALAMDQLAAEPTVASIALEIEEAVIHAIANG